MSSISVYNTVFASGGGTSRYGEFTVVKLVNCSFITTPMEFQQVTSWARGRMSCGAAHRDRTTFMERFETIIARTGSGISTKGNRSVLSRIVKAMKANAMFLEEWSIPRDLDASMEIAKKKAAVTPAVVAPLAAVVEPLVAAVAPLVALVVVPLVAVVVAPLVAAAILPAKTPS
jgi:hypothetical protein